MTNGIRWRVSCWAFVSKTGAVGIPVLVRFIVLRTRGSMKCEWLIWLLLMPSQTAICPL